MVDEMINVQFVLIFYYISQSKNFIIKLINIYFEIFKNKIETLTRTWILQYK